MARPITFISGLSGPMACGRNLAPPSHLVQHIAHDRREQLVAEGREDDIFLHSGHLLLLARAAAEPGIFFGAKAQSAHNPIS